MKFIVSQLAFQKNDGPLSVEECQFIFTTLEDWQKFRGIAAATWPELVSMTYTSPTGRVMTWYNY